MLVDRDRGLMAVLDGPDDVLGAERGIAAEEDARARRLIRLGIDDGHVVTIELESQVALDPRERVLLADREHDVVAGQEHFAQRLRARDFAVSVELVLELVEAHADELAAFDDEFLRAMVDDDLDALFLGVLELPVGRLEELPRLARDDLDVFRAEPQRAAAAVHRRVADADDQHALANRVHVPERDRAEPIDADVNAIARFAAGQAQILAFRSAAAHEHGVVTFVEQRAQARDGRAQLELEAQTRDITDLFVEHLGRQAERRYVRAHEAARSIERFEYHAFVSERREIVGDRQRCAAGADQRDAPAVLARCGLRQPALDVAAVIRGNSLQTTDRDGLFFDATAPTSRLARAVANAPQDSRKDVGFPGK